MYESKLLHMIVLIIEEPTIRRQQSVLFGGVKQNYG